MSWKTFWEKLFDWELWPHKVRYFFISPVWFWYCARSGSFWFFTPSNPTLTFGGFEGESKKEMYEQLPPGSFPKSLYIQPRTDFKVVEQLLQQEVFDYPFVVKPDVGMSGILFRKIEDRQQLLDYHQRMPVDYIIQEMVSYPVEYSIFYYRHPKDAKGVITGFLQKEPLAVTGNGTDTLLQLIEAHPTAKYRLAEMQMRHKDKLDVVLPHNEKYYLTLAANLSRGGNFTNLKHQIDDRLHRVFDELNLYSKTFYYGRYDLKATSVEDLKKGKNFLVLEYNGSGAEPNHIYHSGYTLLQAYREILYHWKVLYHISRYNHNKGIPYWPFFKGWRYLQAAKKHFKLLKRIDAFC